MIFLKINFFVNFKNRIVMNSKYTNHYYLLIIGVVLLLIGLFCMKKKEKFENVSSDVLVFKLKKPNGRYLSLCHNCFGNYKTFLCERGVGVNFVKIPSPSNHISSFYIGVENPSGSLSYLSVDKNGLLCLTEEPLMKFDATFNEDHTVSIYVVSGDPLTNGKYIQKCQWLDGGGMISPRETSVGCTSNLMCVNKNYVCSENKYIVEMNNGIVYN